MGEREIEGVKVRVKELRKEGGMKRVLRRGREREKKGELILFSVGLQLIFLHCFEVKNSCKFYT